MRNRILDYFLVLDGIFENYIGIYISNEELLRKVKLLIYLDLLVLLFLGILRYGVYRTDLLAMLFMWPIYTRGILDCMFNLPIVLFVDGVSYIIAFMLGKLALTLFVVKMRTTKRGAIMRIVSPFIGFVEVGEILAMFPIKPVDTCIEIGNITPVTKEEGLRSSVLAGERAAAARTPGTIRVDTTSRVATVCEKANDVREFLKGLAERGLIGLQEEHRNMLVKPNFQQRMFASSVLEKADRFLTPHDDFKCFQVRYEGIHKDK